MGLGAHSRYPLSVEYWMLIKCVYVVKNLKFIKYIKKNSRDLGVGLSGLPSKTNFRSSFDL